MSAEKRAAEEKIRDMAAMFVKALYEPCTCYSDPEGMCRYCNLVSKAEKIKEELFPT